MFLQVPVLADLRFRPQEERHKVAKTYSFPSLRMLLAMSHLQAEPQ